MGEYILELDRIEKSFGDVKVLNDISLSVKQGEFITLLGPSGCGKTTTLRIIAGLEKPDKGKVYLEGKDVTNAEPNRRNVNTVFQNYALFPHMTVEGNISYSLRLKRLDRARIKETVSKALELVQLVGFEKRMPSELSGGQRQRVAIARALVNNPDIILADEPTGNLDTRSGLEIIAIIQDLNHQGVTVILVTHEHEISRHARQVVHFRDGRLVRSEVIAEPVQARKTLENSQQGRAALEPLGND